MALLGGCGPQQLPAGTTTRAVLGQDGPLTVSTDTVVNRYAELAQDAAAGQLTLTLRDAQPLQPLSTGDLLLIIQMQGAAIDSSNTAAFGTVNALGGAGSFEFATLTSLSGNTLTLDPACPLHNTYTAAGHVQVIRVPQLTTLSVTQSGTITAPQWDGGHGGVVALHVQGLAQIDGAVDVSGIGFRGAPAGNQAQATTTAVTLYRSTTVTDGGQKGEGIAGSQAEYDQLGGRYGRGAPANGGGGGNSHNAAGGGGANGSNGRPWTGAGVMYSTDVGSAAWKLDPEYLTAQGLTSSPGGGRGGYSYATSTAANNPNPLTVGPGGAGWGGNGRRDVGGLGGHPLPADPAAAVFLGGGGGAGSGNNQSAGPGGNGGGLVYLIAGTVQGAGRIAADGAASPGTVNTQNDGSGGGGGGGSVVVDAPAISGVSLSASGGRGGNQQDSATLRNNRESEGPGGGGGGGFIAVAASGAQSSAAGAPGGTTAATSLTNFPANGATAGAAGQAAVLITAHAALCAPAMSAGDDLGQGDAASGGGGDAASGDAATGGGGGDAASGDAGSGPPRYSYAGGGFNCALAPGLGPQAASPLSVAGMAALLLGALLRRRRLNP